LLVECDDEGLVEAVAVEDQQIARELGRSAVAMLRFVRELRLPDDVAGGRQRRRAVRTQMDVDTIALAHRPPRLTPAPPAPHSLPRPALASLVRARSPPPAAPLRFSAARPSPATRAPRR